MLALPADNISKTNSILLLQEHFVPSLVQICSARSRTIWKAHRQKTDDKQWMFRTACLSFLLIWANNDRKVKPKEILFFSFTSIEIKKNHITIRLKFLSNKTDIHITCTITVFVVKALSICSQMFQNCYIVVHTVCSY